MVRRATRRVVSWIGGPILLLSLTPSFAAAEQGPFFNLAAQAVGQGPVGVAIGDFNGDGVPDLAVANSLDATVSILLGNGDGSYQPAKVVSVGNKPGPIAAADLNRDGKADLVVGNVTDGTLGVLLSHGDGTFGPPTAYTVGTPVTIVVGDLTGDGVPDVAVSTVTPFLSGAVQLLSGNGDGTLAAPRAVASYPAPTGPAGVAIADFDGNGTLDLAVTLIFNGDIFSPSSAVDVLLGDGKGGFASRGLANVGLTGPTSIVAGDFDGDGRPDVAVALSETVNLAVLMGNGDGTFQAPTYPPAGPNPLIVATGDIDGDGRLDLVAVSNSSNAVSVLLGNGDGSFKAPVSHDALGGPTGAAMADVNGDGRADVAVTSNLSNLVQVFLGSRDGTIRTGSAAAVANPTSVAVGDFNGDGVLDLVVASERSALVSVLLGDGKRGFRLQGSVALTPNGGGPPLRPLFIQAADLHHEGRADLLVTTSVGGFACRSNGDGTFAACAGVDGGTGPILAVDLNADGNVDLVSSVGDPEINPLVAVGHGDGAFGQSLLPSPSVSGAAVVGDFDGDGRLDLAIGSQGGVDFYSGDGAGTFSGPVRSTASIDVSTLAVGDFNGDGILDVAAGQGAWGSPGGRERAPRSGPLVILLGRGDGTFEEVSGRASELTTSVVASDFNGDGIVDLAFSRHEAGTVGILLGRGDGSFQEVIEYPVGVNPTALALADFDGDGALDLVVVDAPQESGDSPPPGNISVLFGNFIAGASRSTTTRLVSSISAAVVGQPLTLTASVTGPEPPTGIVTFKEDGAVLGAAPIVAGQAQFSTAQLTLGSHGFTARYSGDGNLNGSLSQRTVVTAGPASTTTAVTSSASPSKLGEGVALTATVRPQFTGTPTGTLDFYADGQPIGSGILSEGSATVNAASLGMGTHTIAAEYAGDASFVTSLGTFKQKVGKASSAVTLTSSTASVAYGQPLVLVATVTDSAGITPTGFVVFVEGATVYGTVPLSAGMAQITLSTLTVGTHKITAQYGGDSLDAPSNGTLKQAVVGQPTTSTVTTSAQPSTYGQGVTFTADVTSAVGAPDGNVTFKSGSSVLGIVALSGGEAQLTISTLSSGTRTIAAVYGGSATCASSMATLQQVIEKAATTTTLGSSLNPASGGQAVTFTASVSSAAAETPTGNVTFKDGKTVLGTVPLINGAAQLGTSLLSTGSHSITATFAGAADFLTSKNNLTQLVQ